MSIIDAISSALHDFATWWIGLIEKIFTSIYTMLKDVFLWIFDQILHLVAAVIGDIDLSAINDIPALSSIPDEVLNMLGLLGFAQDMVIIAAAIGIRIFLQLIPFTRLGS